MSRMTYGVPARIMVGLMAAGLVGFCAVEAYSQETIPDLTGKWIGTYTGGVRLGGSLTPADATARAVEPGEREVTLAIDRQDGRGLIGTVSAGSGGQAIHGVIRMDNVTVLFTDKDSVNAGRLISANEMELCHQTTNGTDITAVCLLLRKE